MITNAYNYWIFSPWPAQILLNLEKKRGDDYKCLQLLKFSPWPAQIFLNLEKLQKRWWLQMLTIT